MEANKALARRMHNELFHQQRLEAVEELFAPDYVDHSLVVEQQATGRESVREGLTAMLTAFPDIHFDLTDIVIGPQGVCEEADVTGTHAAPWLGFPPSGERLAWKVVIFFPWDAQRRLFRGEKVYTAGLPLTEL